MGADMTLLDQALTKKAGQQHGKGDRWLHEVCSQWRSRRSFAASSNSGQAERYQ
jgi:hypothetical protein